MSAARKLPSFADLLANYPDQSQEEVKAMIGGGVNTSIVTDTCAVRMSRALNYSGVEIPAKAAKLYVVRGDDKKYYALRMQELKEWIRGHFGGPQVVSRKPVNKEKFSGQKGIIAFDITFGRNPDGVTRALGHLDLWDGSSYIHQAIDPRDYFGMATMVVLWKTPD
jgi:Type VI secretion system (T6SS), amidase effector protein 4